MPRRTLEHQHGRCTQAQWVLGAVLALTVGAFFLFGYRPAEVQQRKLRDAIETQRRDLVSRQSRAANLPAVTLEVDKLRARLDRFDKKLPRQPDLGEFIKQITQVSQQAELRKLSVQPGMPKRTALYAEMPITLKFEGDFLSAESFIRQAEDMQRLTRVKNLTIRNRDSRTGQVDVSLTMSIYFLEG